MIIFFTIAASQLQAQSFVREYTYNASENDSKASARNAALEALKSELIEEVGVSVVSSLENETKVEGDDVKTMIKSQLQTFSIAMTKTEILDEKWDGEKFWIKVKIEVDSDAMKEQVKKTIQVEVEKQNEQLLEPLREEVLLGLRNLRTPERIRAVTSKAVKLPMEGENNLLVHREVLGVFQKYAIDDTLYRDFLVSTLKKIQPDWNDNRAHWIFEYLGNTGSYTKQEIDGLLDFFARMPKSMPNNYYYNFFNKTQTNEVLLAAADAYVSRLSQGKIGRPLPIMLQNEFPTLLRILPQEVSKTLELKWKKEIK
ncbi:hypothetical protein KKA17_06050 [bacterium]|nr:hypothetical protein [bacterium]MBU1884455.1 hypothetical protein [bacterium]